jgi:hypothetical protein
VSQSQYYCSLDFAKELLNTTIASGNTLSAEDKRLLSAIRTVSRRVDNAFQSRRPLFQPYSEARHIFISPFRINRSLGTLDLRDWALAIDDTLVSVNGVQMDVEAYPDVQQPPFRQIRLTACDDDWYTPCGLDDCCSDPLQAEVPAVWGFHRDYLDSAWEAIDALAAQINDAVTTITVSDADGADASGMTPRISPGDLLRIDNTSGAPEFVEVVSANYTTNVITLRRGVNGTAADGHALAAVVYRWNVEEPIKTAVARQAGLMYARRGVYNTVEAGGSAGVVEIRFPNDWLRDAFAMMAEYA